MDVPVNHVEEIGTGRAKGSPLGLIVALELLGLPSDSTGEGGTCRAGSRLPGIVGGGGIGGGLTILREGVEGDGGSCGRGSLGGDPGGSGATS